MSHAPPSTPADLTPHWVNRFHQLGPAFYTSTAPSPLPNPQWIATNPEAAQVLAWPPDWWHIPQALEVFSSRGCWPGMHPIATVYSGHQFGVWAGQLGDGRALLLGEVQTPQGGMEVQLKGCGETPYSRQGDGRAVLRSSIREYLGSIAMQALGVPTTRALCLVGSPLAVQRQAQETAAVVTRLAPSFVRFGHFEHFVYSAQMDELQALADHVVAVHLPTLSEEPLKPKRYAALLAHAVNTTAHLIAQWQTLGFCHGVMNTDNMSILGLTLDYGPFGFLDAYDPMHICNHSDTQGRYAFARQPSVAYWNLCALAQALSPLIQDSARIQQILQTYHPLFSTALLTTMGRKLGLATINSGDADLISSWLELLHTQRVDYTLAFRRLSDRDHLGPQTHTALHGSPLAALFTDTLPLAHWLSRYLQRLSLEPSAASERELAMRAANPRIVLRNHLAHTAIAQATLGDFTEIQHLSLALTHPYEDRAEFDHYAGIAPEWASQIEVSCSS